MNTTDAIKQLKQFTSSTNLTDAMDVLDTFFRCRQNLLALTGEDNLVSAVDVVASQEKVIKDLNDTAEAIHAGYVEVGQLAGVHRNLAITPVVLGDAVRYLQKWIAVADKSRNAANKQNLKSALYAERTEERLNTALDEVTALKLQVHNAERAIGRMVLKAAAQGVEL